MALLNSLCGDLGRRLVAGRRMSWCRYRPTRCLTTDPPTETRNKKKKKNVKSDNGTPKKSYTETLNLPKSQFPMKHSRILELDLEKRAKFSDLYKEEPSINSGDLKEPFILHDGPPYANGDVHFGHCINKTLKDIFLKRHSLTSSTPVHYIPGWDCHGLPIELKAITEDQASQLSPLEIRSRARQLALAAIDRQRSSFYSWFLTGDLTRPYRTFDISYSLAELSAFYQLHNDGLIFRDYMPVYWSPSTRTALAEAELQYNSEHISRAAYIRYQITNGDHLGECSSVHALIWTTTPWTLLANEGIAFSSSIDYSLVSLSPATPTEQYLVATELISTLGSVIPNTSITIDRSGLTGPDLANLRYVDPLSNTEKPFLASGHVSLSKGGTGLVHLAPNHGFDDYKLFKQQGTTNLPYRQDSIVDHLGHLVLPSPLAPIPITAEGNLASTTVLESLLPPTSVVHAHDHQHSYPYDWRSGKPVLIRPSSQWFLDMDRLRGPCLEALDTVRVYPEKLRKELRHQITSRPNWCLSRQRHWGVPIPVFYSKTNDPDKIRPILTETMFNRVMEVFSKEGLDAWWSQSTEKLIGSEEGANLVKGGDIFDIWFDSGCSWASVLGDQQVADLYCEGIDQIRGWFQSSLISSVALRGRAPYRAIFIHGFALDKEGKKMSKSVGNVIDPNDIIENRIEKYIEKGETEIESQSSAKKKKPSSPGACGLDGLRFWIARHASTHNDVHVDVTDFREDSLTMVNRVRNTFRFLLGVLSTNPSILGSEEYTQMPLMDKYLLMRIAKYSADCNRAYEDLSLGDLAQGSIRHLLHEVATFYLSRVKDRLYCDPAGSVEYRSACTVLSAVYHTIGYQLAPILPHILLEANEQLPLRRSGRLEWESVDQLVGEALFADDPMSSEEFQQKMTVVFKVNDALNKWAGTSHRLLEYDAVIVSEEEEVLTSLQFFQADSSPSLSSDLAELLQVASVSYRHAGEIVGGETVGEEVFRVQPSVVTQGTPEEGATEEIVEIEETVGQFEIELIRTRRRLCPRCRRHRLEEAEIETKEETLCERCEGAMKLCSC